MRVEPPFLVVISAPALHLLPLLEEDELKGGNAML